MHSPTSHNTFPADAAQQLGFYMIRSTSSANSPSAFRTTVSFAATPPSMSPQTSDSYIHPDKGDHYNIPGAPHMVLTGYTTALIILGVAFFCVGMAACCFKFVGRKPRRWRTKKSTRPVKVIALTARKKSQTQRIYRGAGHYHIGTIYASPRDLGNHNTQEFEHFRRYPSQQAEQAVTNAYPCNRNDQYLWRQHSCSSERDFCRRCVRRNYGGEQCPKHSEKGPSVSGNAARGEAMRAGACETLEQVPSRNGTTRETRISGGVEFQVGVSPPAYAHCR